MHLSIHIALTLGSLAFRCAANPSISTLHRRSSEHDIPNSSTNATLSRPENGNSLDSVTQYTIVPQDGQSTSQNQETHNYLKTFTGQHQLASYTDANHVLHWWCVNMTSKQAIEITGHDGISEVRETTVNAPPFSEIPTASALDEESPSGFNITKRNDAIKEYLVYPIDKTKGAQTKKIDAFLQTIVDPDKIWSYVDSDDDLRFWCVNITQAQVDQIKKQDGVDDVAENITVAEYFAIVSRSIPSAQITDMAVAKVKRALVYATQTTPVSELRVISQPT